MIRLCLYAFATGLAVGFAILVAGGCATPAILTPPSGPGTEWPCGTSAHQCLDAQGSATGTCCDDGYVCGGQGADSFQTCPAGECCFVGSEGRRAGERVRQKPASP